MRDEYDFSEGKRARDVPHLRRLQEEVAVTKTRITIMLDNDVLEAFRARADGAGRGYQTLINEALRAAIAPDAAPVTIEALRRVLREELHATT